MLIFFVDGHDDGKWIAFVEFIYDLMALERTQRTAKLSARELLHQIAVIDDGSGHYHSEEEAVEHLEANLDLLLDSKWGL